MPQEPRRRGAPSTGGSVLRLAASVVRVTLVTGSLVVLYASAPLDGRPEDAVVARLAAALVVLCATLAWQIRAVTRSTHPGLRAVEAIIVSLPMLILVFAFAYLVTAASDAASFTQPVNRIGGVYFSTTVFTTVGFGDIAPRSDLARMLVTTQMIVDLIVIGVIAKVLVGAVQIRRRSLRAENTTPTS